MIVVTCPPTTDWSLPIFQRLRDAWLHVGEDRVAFRQAEWPTTHGELLETIWGEFRAQDHTEPFIISEIDFIPHPKVLKSTDTLLAGLNKRAIFVPYVFRNNRTGELLQPARTGPEDCPEPYTGAWFMAFDMPSLLAHEPALDWLTAGGPYNDAANLAASHLPDEAYVFMMGVPEAPDSLIMDYPGFGAHLFASQYYSLPPAQAATKALWIPGLTVAKHLEQIERRLDAAGW